MPILFVFMHLVILAMSFLISLESAIFAARGENARVLDKLLHQFSVLLEELFFRRIASLKIVLDGVNEVLPRRL